MALERLPRAAPAEKTFAQLFPWRNIRRAMMLVLLIVGIVVIKRSAQPLLQRAGQMWGSPRTASPVQIRAVVRPAMPSPTPATSTPPR
jgi:hypothetical protein